MALKDFINNLDVKIWIIHILIKLIFFWDRELRYKKKPISSVIAYTNLKAYLLIYKKYILKNSETLIFQNILLKNQNFSLRLIIRFKLVAKNWWTDRFLYGLELFLTFLVCTFNNQSIKLTNIDTSYLNNYF